jgi:hypothetical protein
VERKLANLFPTNAIGRAHELAGPEGANENAITKGRIRGRVLIGFTAPGLTVLGQVGGTLPDPDELLAIPDHGIDMFTFFTGRAISPSKTVLTTHTESMHTAAHKKPLPKATSIRVFLATALGAMSNKAAPVFRMSRAP